jgi:aminopeptidase N
MKNKFIVAVVMLAVAASARSTLAQRGQNQTLGRLAPTDTSDRPQINVESYAIDLTIDPEEHAIKATADLQFRQLERKNFATFDLDRRLHIASVTAGSEPVRFRQFDLDSTFEVDLGSQQFSGAPPTLHIEYAGVLDPSDDRRDGRNAVLNRVSEDSAFLLYEGKWFPTNGLYKNKANMRLRVHAPQGWTVVSDLTPTADGFASNTPSYWGMVAAGKYTATKVKTARNEITVDTLKASSDAVSSLAETAGKILDFYTETFGPPPSTQFRIVEVQGSNWPSQWSAGSLLLPSSQFRADFDVDALARTLAHQWFPLKVTVTDPAADAWLVDGMAVFASMMYFEKALSPAEAQEHVHKALVKALGYEGNTSIRQAGGLDKDTLEYHSLVEYKGGYVLRMLQWVIGDEKFHDLMTRYLERFASKPASTDAFIKLASEVVGQDLNYFFEQWLNNSGVPEFDDKWVVNRVRSGYKVDGEIKQDLDLFRMPVELQIETDGEPDYKRVDVSGPSSDFSVNTDRKPKSLIIDPHERILRMSPGIRVAVLVNRGEEFTSDGRFNDAIDEYQRAIDIDKNSSLAAFRMGEALFELGNTQAAANTFRDALNGDLKPKWIEVWTHINLGKIYDYRGQRDRAVPEYQKAINTGDDAYGAQAEAQKYLTEPFRKGGK